MKRSLVNFITFLPNSMYLSVTIFNSTVNDLLPNYNNQTALDDGMRRAMINAIIDLQLQSDGNAIVGLRLALDQSISVFISIWIDFLQDLFINILFFSFSKEGGKWSRRDYSNCSFVGNWSISSD